MTPTRLGQSGPARPGGLMATRSGGVMRRAKAGGSGPFFAGPGLRQVVDAPASSMVDTGEGRRRLAGERGPGWRGGDSPHTGPLTESVRPERVCYTTGR